MYEWDAATAAATGTMLRDLLAASHLAGPDDLPRLVRDAARHLGASEAVAYVVDYDQVVLVPLADGAGGPPPLPVEGTLAGKAYADSTPYDGTADGVVCWLPILDGTERLGVLQLAFPPGAALHDGLRAACLALASAVAELLLTRRPYGDLVERARRRLPLTLAAEVQWTQLPPLTFATPRVAVTGVLAPTHEVAGDSFDYAMNGDVLHVAIVDGMGHGLEAALMSLVAIGALRNARRIGLDLVGTARSVDKHLSARFGSDAFVTGIVGELDVASGVYRWVTAGHPPALLIRQARVVKSLDSAVNPPLGILGERPAVGEERLERGDRLLLHTDGVVEARDASGEFFGEARLVELVTKESAAGRPAPETLRRLNLAILGHQAGDLQDDATTLFVEWLGVEPARLTV